MNKPKFSETEIANLEKMVEFWDGIDLIEDKKEKMRRINAEAHSLFHAIPAINVLRCISYWCKNRKKDGVS